MPFYFMVINVFYASYFYNDINYQLQHTTPIFEAEKRLLGS